MNQEIEVMISENNILKGHLRGIGAMCFNCSYWAGKIKKEKGYCYKWHLSGKKDAPSGTRLCLDWSKRKNARLKPCS